MKSLNLVVYPISRVEILAIVLRSRSAIKFLDKMFLTFEMESSTDYRQLINRKNRFRHNK